MFPMVPPSKGMRIALIRMKGFPYIPLFLHQQLWRKKPQTYKGTAHCYQSENHKKFERNTSALLGHIQLAVAVVRNLYKFCFCRKKELRTIYI